MLNAQALSLWYLWNKPGTIGYKRPKSERMLSAAHELKAVFLFNVGWKLETDGKIGN